MADEQGPAFVSFAGGAFSGRVESTMRESLQQTFWNSVSIDAGGAFTVGAGATIGASMTSQTSGYQIQAAVTQFNTVTPAVTGNGNTPTAACVLPQTNRPFPFTGMLLYIINNGANPINCFPHPNDPSNSINGQAANASVVLGVGTITAFTTVTPGIWWADGIGEGASGSITTTVSQGNVVSAGTSNTTATAITQGIVNFTSGTINGTAGGVLPPAKAGMQIAVANNAGAGTITIYGNGSDTINGGASTTVAATSITLFICAVNGNWLTK